MKQPPAIFSPFNGLALMCSVDVETAHWRSDIHTWHFNPWTAAKRDPGDVAQDPHGLLIWDDRWGLLVAAAPTADMVNHPPHYTAGKVECIDALEAATTGLTGIDAVCTASAIKYLWRWKQKGGVEDLKKARWYIDRLIGDAP